MGEFGQIRQALRVCINTASLVGHHHMGDHPEDAPFELPFETVHHRNDHHQGGDPDGNAKSREQGDK